MSCTPGVRITQRTSAKPTWMKLSDPEIYRLGGSGEVSAGILGFLSVVAGGEMLGAVGTPVGTSVGPESHFYVGGRLSLLSIIYILKDIRL